MQACHHSSHQIIPTHGHRVAPRDPLWCGWREGADGSWWLGEVRSVAHPICFSRRLTPCTSGQHQRIPAPHSYFVLEYADEGSVTPQPTISCSSAFLTSALLHILLDGLSSAVLLVLLSRRYTLSRRDSCMCLNLNSSRSASQNQFHTSPRQSPILTAWSPVQHDAFPG